MKKPEQKQEARKQAAASVTTPRVLRKIPDIQRVLRSALEQAFLEKLETLGVRAVRTEPHTQPLRPHPSLITTPETLKTTALPYMKIPPPHTHISYWVFLHQVIVTCLSLGKTNGLTPPSCDRG